MQSYLSSELMGVSIATLAMASARDLITAYPVIGFVCMGILGGVAGWTFALEDGSLDHLNATRHARFVVRRSLLGGLLGIALWLLWEGYRPVSVYVAMAVAGGAGAFPVKACNYAHRMVRRAVAKAVN